MPKCKVYINHAMYLQMFLLRPLFFWQVLSTLDVTFEILSVKSSYLQTTTFSPSILLMRMLRNRFMNAANCINAFDTNSS